MGPLKAVAVEQVRARAQGAADDAAWLCGGLRDLVREATDRDDWAIVEFDAGELAECARRIAECARSYAVSP